MCDERVQLSELETEREGMTLREVLETSLPTCPQPKLPAECPLWG